MTLFARDRGSITAFVVAMSVTLIAFAGLALDSGRMIAAHIEAADHAENAARRGAQEVHMIRAGLRWLDTSASRKAALDYLTDHGVHGSVTATRDAVTVTVSIEQETFLLDLVGVDRHTVSATRTAGLVAG